MWIPYAAKRKTFALLVFITPGALSLLEVLVM
jgi:hypothetical protein